MRILRIVSLMIRELITSRELTYKILANLLFMGGLGNRELNYQEVKSFIDDNEGTFDLVEWVLFDEYTEKVYEAEVDKL